MHWAAWKGDIEVVRSLIRKGADVNGKNDRLCTPLHYAAEQGHVIVAELLIANGADVNAKAKWNNGGTPLHEAASKGYMDIARILIANGANPNAQDEFGSFLLHEIVADNYPAIVKLLLDYGADANMVDAYGQTPLHEAAWNDCKEMIDLIIAKGADINTPDRNGDTPLHVAALNGYTELYDRLVAKGADIHAKNDQGKTPVDYANSRPPQEVVILSEGKPRPCSVIITNLKHIRRFLKSEMIDFDQIWIPEKSNVEGLVPALRTCLEKKSPFITQSPFFDRAHVLKYLHKYNQEYTGFFKDGIAYIICNMSLGIDINPQDNLFTYVLDGGSNFLRVVFGTKSKEVVSIDCNGM